MRSTRVLAAVVTALVVVGSVDASAEVRSHPVTGWVRRHAVPLDDREALRPSIGDAEIVGLGESVHGAAELISLKHDMLRFLVEEMGFRSVAWEEQWTTGVQVNDYITTGTGDLDALMSQMSPPWQSREVADVLLWLRDFNAGRTDKVQFVGVEFYLTGRLAYESVDAYVASTAPERLEELRGDLNPIRPATDNIFDHIDMFENAPDRQLFVDRARRVHDLVAGLPRPPGDLAHALALQHARQIIFFYEHFILPDPERPAYRDAHAAENLRWWRDLSGDKIAYWAASPHTANAPQLRIAVPPEPDLVFASAGSYLRRWYGPRYLSIGFTFDHGVVRLRPGETAAMSPPAPEWFERPFGRVRLDQFALDLRHRAPPPVRRWLEAPIITRGLADGGPDSVMTGGTLAQWFDVIVHRQEVSPTT